MNNETKLKPCPFCRQKPKLYNNYIYGEELFHYYCPKCGIKASSDFTKKLAIEKWNRKIGKMCENLDKKQRKDK